MLDIFEQVLKIDNKSGNSIVKALSGSGLDVRKKLIYEYRL